MSWGVGCVHPDRDFIQNQGDEVIAWQCRRCLTIGTSDLELHLRREAPHLLTRPDIDECEWCGNNFDSSKRYKIKNHTDRWIFKRYCSRICYFEDLEDRRETGRKISNRDPYQRGKEICRSRS